jgi:hypothetical protein
VDRRNRDMNQATDEATDGAAWNQPQKNTSK